MRLFGPKPGRAGSSIGGELNQPDPLIRRSQVGEAAVNYCLKALESGPQKAASHEQFFVSPYKGLLDKLSLSHTAPVSTDEALQPVINESKTITDNTYPAAVDNRPVAAPVHNQELNFVSDEIRSAQLAVDAALDSEPKITDVVDSQLDYEDPQNGAYGA